MLGFNEMTRVFTAQHAVHAEGQPLKLSRVIEGPERKFYTTAEKFPSSWKARHNACIHEPKRKR